MLEFYTTFSFWVCVYISKQQKYLYDSVTSSRQTHFHFRDISGGRYWLSMQTLSGMRSKPTNSKRVGNTELDIIEKITGLLLPDKSITHRYIAEFYICLCVFSIRMLLSVDCGNLTCRHPKHFLMTSVLAINLIAANLIL